MLNRRNFMKMCGAIVATPAILTGESRECGDISAKKKVWTITAISYNRAVYDCDGANDTTERYRQSIKLRPIETKIDVADTFDCVVGDIIQIEGGCMGGEYRIARIQEKC